MTTMEMLRFLTQKLRSQSLNEIEPFQPEIDDDRDSGTESDDENAELEAIEKQLQENQKNGVRSPSSPIPSTSPLVHTFTAPFSSDSSPSQHTDLSETSSTPCSDHCSSRGSLEYEQSCSDLERTSCTSSIDFERHSSEEELTVITSRCLRNRELHPEKRKWSQANCGSYGESSGSSDEEVRDLLSKPQPLLFSSSPPKGVQKLHGTVPAKIFLAKVTPIQLCSVSPRKRHRKTNSIDVSDSGTVIQRPCLDFEKMQQRFACKSGFWSYRFEYTQSRFSRCTTQGLHT